MYKSQLQELCHKRSWTLPEYRTVRDGPDHNPRFTSTVTVNGVPFETPLNQCRSSKESQNLAAQLAFEKLSISISPSRTSITVSHVSGASSSSTPTDINPEQHALHPNQENPFGCRGDTGSNEILHTFKNRLQHFAQKHNLSMPAYCSEFEGPPHARRFRSKVTIADKTFESSEFFPNLKEAEHAAAKIAFETLSPDDIQEDEGLYKTLLQELAQKKGLQFPKYSTAKSGPPHLPTFISSVEVGTDDFQGLEAKTKKQAEMSAAKVAYNALLKCKEEKAPSGYHIKGTTEVTSFNLQSTINKGSVHDIALSHPNTGEAAVNKECIVKEALSISTPSARFVTDRQHGIQPTKEQTWVKKQNTDQDAKLKGQLSSNSAELNAQFQDSSPLTSSPGPSSSAKLKHPKGEVSDTKDCQPVASGHKSSRKFIVYPKDVKMETPNGASIMAYSDDQYVALKLKDESLQ